MKKFNVISMLVAVSALALTACQEKSKNATLKGSIVHYEQEFYTSTHRGLRTLGMGYATENYKKVTTDKGSYFQVNEAKALIVGVDFTDYPAANLPKGEEGTLDDLHKAILGKSEDTGWESLKSYYYKSSFGVCNIDGVVANQWYHTNTDVKGFYNGVATDGVKETSATQILAQKVSDWAKDTLGLDLTQFDANQDGFIDSVIMIYTCPPHVTVPGISHDKTDDLYWAFCWSTSAEAKDASLEKPAAYRFFWSSYYTFYEDGYYDENKKHQDWTNEQIKNGEAKLDAHTLIHEFGHALSLPDYYNGDYGSSDKNAYDPLGALDMMAWNVGDHNAFSKALYGWISPYLVYGNATITMRSTTDTGDFVVIPVDYIQDPTSQFTLLSQYLMVEFLTPTGVAYADSLDAYAGSYPVWYSIPGVRVTLVDARMGRFDYSGKFQGFTGAVSAGTGYYVSFACDNNKIARSFSSKCKLIEIIPATGIEAKYLVGGRADNACLYQEGDEFNTTSSNTKWPGFCVDDNAGSRTKPFKFGFTIKKMTSSSVTIDFTGGFEE